MARRQRRPGAGIDMRSAGRAASENLACVPTAEAPGLKRQKTGITAVAGASTVTLMAPSPPTVTGYVVIRHSVLTPSPLRRS